MPTNLMGIDVGFSKTRQTTGIACLEGDQLSLERAGTAWESREARIPPGFQPSVNAIDGPLLPLGADLQVRRHVESVFICAPFHNADKGTAVIIGEAEGRMVLLATVVIVGTWTTKPIETASKRMASKATTVLANQC
jgi:hypothetical protein